MTAIEWASETSGNKKIHTEFSESTGFKGDFSELQRTHWFDKISRD